ncbi:kinesin-like protein KIF13A [Notechis scutatus]|uniref:Kinesin-like protein KIF13A n=1 Tax=Notechis scutatus TaxID=8663 RepID=A0A6J1UB41_9SAUR|nr:kinesin-like protein KIF13A [Notechis scutatus]
MSDTKVKVAVRVRPMNRRELELNTKCVVEMEGNQTVLHPPPSNNKQGESRKLPKVFAFDYCFWSMDESNTAKYADQQVVFKCLGEGILEKAFQGYNACIFAYGQTGSGKSFSMMGNAEQLGLIPRLCCALFQRITLEQNDSHTFKVEVSYMEIYNEKVRDLLDPKGSRQSLKVREHKVLGPYVDGLSQLAVTCFEDIESLMSEGNKSRTVAATNMNEESSRSHAVFNIIITQTLYDLQSGNSGEKVSKVSLVDLAGSERVSKTGAAGERLKEGSNINKSLSTLGLVISSLADQAAGKGKNKFVPYRDSVLTWLLKDNLGGNSQTAMIATISPAADNYEETLSTLRYADRAKRIVNHAIVNEDPNARVIRELREEVEKLKEQLSQAESMKAPELKEKLEESEKLIKELTITWEEKLRKTEEIAQERQKQLESMGISLESSGIKMGEDKCYLVNLNADPALNELLLYYLKDHTRVGADTSQDIQLFGIGIQPEHCEIDIALDGEVSLSPKENARSCVNGTLVCSVTQLWHGDRILWGNNHFFRINLPKRKRRDCFKDSEKEKEHEAEQDLDAASEASSEPDYNYEFAQMEVIMKMLNSNDPLQNVVQVLEKQYLEEKRSALEEQRIMYERELEQLRQQLSPERHYQQCGGSLSDAAQTAQQKINFWSEERDELFRQSLAKLREQIVKANALVREANFLAEEMSKLTDYQVTLQIPAANLNANRKRGAIVSEPAIQVKRKGKSTQVWTIEKLENKLIDMRELYQEWKESSQEMKRLTGKRGDPFYEAQENHNLIGVANVFLECLFCDVKLQYAVPIISQQGEVVGRLHVEVMRVTGAVPERVMEGDDSSENSSESGSLEIMDNNGEIIHRPKKFTCRVKIKEATGLPLNLSNFVFCQYTFWDQCEPTVAAPVVDPDVPSPLGKDVQFTVTFSHCRDYVVNVTEEFLEFIADGALAVEVWGHRCAGNGTSIWEVDSLRAKSRTLRDRWNEVTRRIEMWVSIQELNEIGDYAAVELHQAKDVNTGGIFQLRQGHSRRVQVVVTPVQHSGTLPLMVEAILSISIGCVTARSTKLQRGLDSYQKGDDDDGDMDSYQVLLLLLLNHTAWGTANANCHESIFRILAQTVLAFEVLWISATAAWDSSVHDSVHLNRVTPQNERIYLIVKITVQLSHPATMELVLRKRIAANIYNKQSFTQSLKRRISLKNIWYACGVTYEIVSNIPKATEEIEDRETLALMAARHESEGTSDGETYIEKYIRGVLQVENILSLERLRQAVTVKEALSAKTRHLQRSISTPNVHNVSSSRLDLSGCDEDKGWLEGHLDVIDCSSYQDISCYGTLPRDSPHKNKDNSENLHTSSISSFKAFSPQPPKFFKPLMPVREENKKASLETQPLLSKESMPSSQVYNADCVVLSGNNGNSMPFELNSIQEAKTQDSEEDDDLEINNKKPYVPVEFADFSIYNASLENKEWLSTKGDCTNSCVTAKEVSRSPTTSSITSGYFSHSASNATLSDMLIPCSESMDQLANQTRDLDSNDHSVAHLTHVLKSSNQAVSEAERDFAKCKKMVLPITGTCALATEVQVSESTNVNAPGLQGSSLDSSTNKHEIEFPSREATVEHISNVFEDRAFTEFMGVDDTKEFECSTSITANRKKKFLAAGMNSLIPFSKNVHDQDSALSCLESGSVRYDLSSSVENPLLNAREKESSNCQQCADSLPVGDFVGKNHLDVPSSEDTISEEHSNWLAVGEQVYVDDNKTGTVRYIGPVDFSTGTWVGIELHVQMGKHDGTVKGREYFHCKPQHGIFVRPECLAKSPAQVKLRSRTSQSQVLSNVEKLKSSTFQGSSSLKAEAFCQSGDAAASAFSRKQEIRKSWIN